MPCCASSSQAPVDVLRLRRVDARLGQSGEFPNPVSDGLEEGKSSDEGDLRRDLAPGAGVSGDGATPSLQDLMERYVDGDVNAFEDLFRQVAPKLYSYLLRLTRNRERAEDLVQITFAKIHRARASYLRGAPVLPWVLAIARRSFFDERRRAKARHEDLTFDGTVPEPKAAPDQLPNDVAESLERALARLPESYREAIQLTKFTGLSVAETAQVLGTTETAVKLRVHRGYNQLRAELDRYRRETR